MFRQKRAADELPFDKAVIRLANGKTLSVLANNPEKNIYINKVEIGRAHV